MLRKAISIATTFSTSFIPAEAPVAAASMRFTSVRSTWYSTCPAVSGFPVSGTMILAIMSAAGAFTRLAASRKRASTPSAMYAASIPPDTVAIPETMTAWSSDRVIRSRYGATSSGASV